MTDDDPRTRDVRTADERTCLPTDPGLRWTSHPLKEEPLCKSALLLAFILALAVGVGLSFGGLIYALLTFGLLAGFMSRYFAPTRYECSPLGLRVSHLGSRRLRPWARFHRIVPFPEGIFLSPFSRPSRLDRFQGTFIRYSGNGDEVRSFVEKQLSIED